jgi:hypothetical protein
MSAPIHNVRDGVIPAVAPSAPITEAHLRLANQLVSSPPSPLVLAQLIADSEARAFAEMTVAATKLFSHALTENNQLRAERDAARAEVARLDAEKPWLTQATATIASFRVEADQLRAEVEHFKFLHQCESDSSVEAFARAERAEAELAAERARLDWLNKLKTESDWNEAQFVWNNADTDLRGAIDAAMKEGAK